MNIKQTRTMNRFFFLALVGTALAVFQSFLLWAQSIPPGQVKISTPAYSPSLSFKPLMGIYAYSVSWNGIPAARLELEVARNGDDYQLKARAQTAKAIDLIYRLRYHSETVISAQTLMPKRSVSVSRANWREKRTELVFLPSGEIHSVERDQRGKQKTLQFDPANFTLDPYSAGFLALSQDWKVGEKRQFDTFNGKNRYLIELTALEQTEITVNGRIRKAVVIRPSVKKLTDTDPDPKKLREARIYISTDDSREILKISSEVFVGSVNTDLVSFTPAITPKTAPAMKINKINAPGMAPLR
ncbi:MAG: DUF3108 domain-containing protein [Desulfosalsimonadaceae bacterium]|nr:DUF3108 domain-containing protein [Desulfosalsimonadaceae bacterium]